MQCLSFILLRQNMPNIQRPYRSPVGSVGALLTILIALATLYYQLQDPIYRKGVIGAAIWYFAGIIYFAIVGRHKLVLSPEEEFAMTRGTHGHPETEGYGKAIARVEGEGSDLPLRLTTDLRVGFEGKRAHASTTMREGDERFVALSWSDHEAPQSYEDAADRMWRTQEYWREWLNHGEFPDHPWRVHLQRSALTLKGLTYAPTGALMAAATTSLPETPGG